MQLFTTKLRLNLKHINVSSFLKKTDIAKLGRCNEARTTVNGAIVGHSAIEIAEKAGLKVPAGTKLLLAEIPGCNNGTTHLPWKLSPVLAPYQILMALKSIQKKQKVCSIWVVLDIQLLFTLKWALTQYGIRMKACRVLVNSPSAEGGIGNIYNNMIPSLTLGCGSYGHNSVSQC